MRTRIAVAVALAASTAEARPIHGSLGAGGTLVLTGEQGDRTRAELAAELMPRGRLGAIVAWRAFDFTAAERRHGLVLAGVIFEAAAARPRLVLALHAELGAELDQRAPVVGGGVRTTLAIVGPLGLAFDTGGYLVLDGIDDSRLQLQASTSLVVRW